MCFRNAGLYIKIGQHLGSLDYLLPKEYTKVLKVFHHTAPRSSLEDIHHVIWNELGQLPDELFESFDTEPLGMRHLLYTIQPAKFIITTKLWNQVL